jgi:adenylate cyclase
MSVVSIDQSTRTDSAGRKVFEGRLRVSRDVDEAWAIMADTQHINEVVFDTEPVDLIGPAETGYRLRTHIGPLAVEFDEQAWLFDAPHTYKSTRHFHNGPLKRLDVACTIAADEGDGAAITYQVALTTGGLIGFAADKILLNKIEKGFARLPALFEAEPGHHGLAYATLEAQEIAARAAPWAQATIALDPAGASRVQRLVDWLSKSTESEAARLRPYALARVWKEDREAVLRTFLYATKTGLVVMRWDILCPSCAGPVAGAAALKDAHDDHRCDSCGVHFAVDNAQNVEAAFAPLPSIRHAEPALFCLGSPRRSAHWISQFTLAPGEARTLTPTWSSGRYGLQAAGVVGRTVLDVGATGSPSAAITLEPAVDERGARLPAHVATLHSGPLQLTVKNGDTHSRRFQLVHDAFADDAATAAHVVALPLYRTLFG